MPLTAEVQLNVQGKQTNPLDLGSGSFPFSLVSDLAFTNGVAADQADRAFTDTRTLAASATENLDVAGVLVDPFGATQTLATLKAVIIRAAEGNTNDVQLTRPASNGVPLFMAAGDGIAIKPGGIFMWIAPGAGVAVTAGTGDLLTVTNSGAGSSVSYDVILLGTSA